MNIKITINNIKIICILPTKTAGGCDCVPILKPTTVNVIPPLKLLFNSLKKISN